MAAARAPFSQDLRVVPIVLTLSNPASGRSPRFADAGGLREACMAAARRQRTKANRNDESKLRVHKATASSSFCRARWTAARRGRGALPISASGLREPGAAWVQLATASWRQRGSRVARRTVQLTLPAHTGRLPGRGSDMQLPLLLDRSGRDSLTNQIVDQLRSAIGEGRLARGARLPSSRRLAEQLEGARTTVIRAYETLAIEG